MDNIRTRFAETWTQLQPWQRFVGIGAVVSLIGLVTVMSLWAREPEYALLYRNLSERDAAAIVADLDAQGIRYQLLGNGTTIEVESEHVATTRLRLAAAGLPQGSGQGFEQIFEKDLLSNLGTTDFLQRVNYQRALEGELARTITAIEGVEVARVHTAVPEESLFVEQQQEPTASVILKLVPGMRLRPGHVQTIRFLVANSIEGLKASNITVADVDGNLYEAVDTEGELGATAASGSQFDTQQQMELMTQRDLQAMLDAILGPRKAIVRVNYELNWDREESVLEIYAPAGEVGSVVRSTTTEEENWTGAAGEAAAGVPGVDPNAPADLPSYPAGGANDGEYNRQSNTTNYEVSKEERHIIRMPGNLKRASVAVLMDESIPEEAAEAVRRSVEAAVGFDPERGDLIEVQRIPFVQDPFAQQAAVLDKIQQRELYMQIATIVGILLGLGLILFFVRKIFGDMQQRMMPYVVEPSTPALTENGTRTPASLQTSAANAYAGASGGPDYDSDELYQLPAPDEAEIRLKAIARRNPEHLASILKKWAAKGDDAQFQTA